MKKLMDLLVYILTPKMTKNWRIYYFISQILEVFPTFVGDGGDSTQYWGGGFYTIFFYYMLLSLGPLESLFGIWISILGVCELLLRSNS